MEKLKKADKLLKTSEARNLLKKTFLRQSKEYSTFYGQRVIGLLLFFLSMYMPLHLFKVFNNELDWLCKEYYYLFVVGWKICIDAIAYSYLLFYSIIYRLNHPFFEQHKINVDPWPWESDPEGYEKDSKKMLKQSFLITSIIAGALNIINHWVGLIEWNYDLKDLPSFYMILIQFVFCYFCQEFWYYWAHRMAHHPKLYWMHKDHHESVHTVAVAFKYFSVLEWLLIEGVAAFIGPTILGNK